jgi:NAD(P)H-dependent FMN reductase
LLDPLDAIDKYQSSSLDGGKVDSQRTYSLFYRSPKLNLPLLDRMYKEMKNPPGGLRDLQNKIKNAEGYLAVTPEYNHSTSAAMKNTLDYFLEE